MTDLLEVRLGDVVVGQLTLLAGDRTFFAFEESYLNDANRPVLSQSFFTQTGGLISETKTTQTKLSPFFSNLLPEGHLRSYLAAKGGIKPSREFKLIELLGEDLPGAVIVKPLEGMGFLGIARRDRVDWWRHLFLLSVFCGRGIVRGTRHRNMSTIGDNYLAGAI